MSGLVYTDSMINEIRELLLNARQRVAVHVNTELLSTYWNVGRIIVEHEQDSKDRADYGKQNLCAAFIKAIEFNRQCLLNCRGHITVNF